MRSRTSRLDMTPEERFWSHVDTGGPEECWPWTAATNHRGYGQTTLDGVAMNAHRAAWILMNGPIAPGLMACHRCDVRLCVNPTHLFLGSARVNTADMFAKGRNGAATLSDYGAGKQNLLKALKAYGVEVGYTAYDPAFPLEAQERAYADAVAARLANDRARVLALEARMTVAGGKPDEIRRHKAQSGWQSPTRYGRGPL